MPNSEFTVTVRPEDEGPTVIVTWETRVTEYHTAVIPVPEGMTTDDFINDLCGEDLAEYEDASITGTVTGYADGSFEREIIKTEKGNHA